MLLRCQKSRIASDLGRKLFPCATLDGHSFFSAGAATPKRGNFGGFCIPQVRGQRQPGGTAGSWRRPMTLEALSSHCRSAGGQKQPGPCGLRSCSPSEARLGHFWVSFRGFKQGRALTGEGCAAGAAATPRCTMARRVSMDSSPKTWFASFSPSPPR